jgi:hypothetical protein
MLPNLPLRPAIRRLVSVTISGLVVLWFTSPALANVKVTQLSSDPYTNTTSQHATEVEPDTFSFGSTIVAAFQVGRFFNGGASNIGFATSTNGGKSFTPGFLPGTTINATPSGPYARASDASVAFDARHGAWLISYLGLVTTTVVDVVVSRSTDGGVTWGNPVVINNDGHFNDKNWTVCDNTVSSPFYGNCYTEFDDNTLGDLEQMSTSTDGGLTWGPSLANADRVHGIGGQPLVEPNGSVVVPFDGFSFSQFIVKDFTSTDGGLTWGHSRAISIDRYHRPGGGIRAGIPLPSAEIDAAGKIFLAWPDCRFEVDCSANDPVFTTTTDGVSWTPVTRIPADPKGSGVDHFIFGLGVDRSTSGTSGHLALTFYFYPNGNCTSGTCALEVGSTTSADGGASWTANSMLAGPMTLSWLPKTTQGRMVADYISTSFSGAPAFPAFAVATAPTSGGSDCFIATPNCNEAIFTASGGLSVSSAIAATDVDNAGAGEPSETASTLTDQ